MLRRGRLIAVVATFLIGCAVLASHSPGAATEEGRCEGTRIIATMGFDYTTNDVPGCPRRGLLSGTDRQDYLYGGAGEDEVRGLGADDDLWGGLGGDVIYGGPGSDLMESSGARRGGRSKDVLYGGEGADTMFGDEGEDVLYGGDGNDFLGSWDSRSRDNQRDELYCGAGRDEYVAGRLDYVSSSCEKGTLVDTGGPPLILLAGAALLSIGLLLGRYGIRRVSKLHYPPDRPYLDFRLLTQCGGERQAWGVVSSYSVGP